MNASPRDRPTAGGASDGAAWSFPTRARSPTRGAGARRAPRCSPAMTRCRRRRRRRRRARTRRAHGAAASGGTGSVETRPEPGPDCEPGEVERPRLEQHWSKGRSTSGAQRRSRSIGVSETTSSRQSSRRAKHSKSGFVYGATMFTITAMRMRLLNRLPWPAGPSRRTRSSAGPDIGADGAADGRRRAGPRLPASHRPKLTRVHHLAALDGASLAQISAAAASAS